MNLFERVMMHIKSTGHAIESEEHNLLNDFVTYLGSDKVVSGFSDSPVVKSFVASIVPQPDPTPVVIAPPPVIPAPEPEPVVGAPVETPVPVETPSVS